MSDWEGDIDDELLELAGATEKKRKRSQQNGSSKRRKAEYVLYPVFFIFCLREVKVFIRSGLHYI